jgi:large subunit ribosomal protein L30
MPGSFRVTLRKSPISYTAKARGTVRALGLHRIGQTVEVVDNPQTRGMARAVSFLVDVEDARDGSIRPTGRQPLSAREPSSRGEAKASPRREATAARRSAGGEGDV